MESRRRRRERGEDLSVRTGHRRARLERLIEEVLDAVLRDELLDPLLEGVVLIALDLSPDGHHVFVFFSAPDSARSAEALARATPFLRTCLTDRLGLKRVPHLHWAPDPRGASWLE